MKSRIRQDKGDKTPAMTPLIKREEGDQAFCFSRPFFVEALPATGAEVEIEANERERAALAKLNDLNAIDRLIAHFKVTKQNNGLITVRGRLEAAVTQTCVITLDPFDSEINTEVDVDFAEEGFRPAPALSKKTPGEDLERDPPDSIIGGRIDLGALAAEFLSLSLDLYPKKPGAHFEDIDNTEAPEPTSPFSILGKFVQKK